MAQSEFVNDVMKELVDGPSNEAKSGPIHHAPRRSKDLKTMARSLLTQSSLSPNAFDKFWSQLWSYGCHCFDKDTDRPLSSMGKGEPMDKLDSACRNYKRCQQCASQVYGDNCIGELVEYDYVSVGGGSEPLRHILLTNEPEDSCEHKIFECDHRFALDMLEHHEINLEFTLVDSKSGWNRTESCHARRHHGTKPKYDHQCCHTGDAFTWYNANARICCPGKSTKKIGETC